MARSRRWTKEEESFLIKNMGIMKEKEIAEKLDRTVNAIAVRKKLIRKGVRVVDDIVIEDEGDSTCPCCNSDKTVNEITTYDPYRNNTIQAYYCVKCGIEFRRNRTIIPYTENEVEGF